MNNLTQTQQINAQASSKLNDMIQSHEIKRKKFIMYR